MIFENFDEEKVFQNLQIESIFLTVYIRNQVKNI